MPSSWRGRPGDDVEQGAETTRKNKEEKEEGEKVERERRNGYGKVQ